MNRLISFAKKTQLRCIDCRFIAMKISADGKDIPKKKNTEPRITLISSDDSVSITTLNDAQNLSYRRDLKLVKIQDEDVKSRRPIYKLMSNAEYHKEELESRKAKKQLREKSLTKGEKILNISCQMHKNDLMTAVKKMMKMLQKRYEVRVLITDDSTKNSEKLEEVYSLINENLKAVGKIVQKRPKGNSLKFQVVPLKMNNEDTDGAGDSSQTDDKGPI